MEVKCKSCGKLIEIHCDPEYAAMGDPCKILDTLLAILVCNACADYKEERLRLSRAIREICVRLAQGMVGSGEARERVYEAVERLCKSYVRLMADRKGVAVPEWDASIADTIMAKPALYSEVLKRIPELFRQKDLL